MLNALESLASEYGFWAPLFITPWFIAGAVPAAGIIVISQMRKRATKAATSVPTAAAGGLK